VYFKFIHPPKNGESYITLIESTEARYIKYTFQDDFYKISPPNFNPETMLIESFPPNSKKSDGCKVIIMQYTDFKGSKQWRVAPNCNLFVMNETGKTIDSVLCFMQAKGE